MGILSPSDWTNALSDDPTGSKAVADTASSTQLTMFDKTQENLAPYMSSGKSANALLNTKLPFFMTTDNRLSSALSGLTSPYSLEKYQSSPEYTNSLNAMNDMLNQLKATGAAGGNLGSGNMATALQSNANNLAMQGYSQGLADYQSQNLNAFNMINSAVQSQQGQNLNAFNMLNTMSGSGQNAAAGLGGFGANVANQIGQNSINAALSNSAARLGAQQNLMSGFQNDLQTGVNAYGAYNQNQLLQNYMYNQQPAYNGMATGASYGVAASDAATSSDAWGGFTSW